MRDAGRRENEVADSQDAPAIQGGHERAATKPWSFAQVRVRRDEGGPAGDPRLVLQGVYEAADDATLAAAISDHILEELRQHSQTGWPDESPTDGAAVRVRITIQWLPHLWEVPPAGAP